MITKTINKMVSGGTPPYTYELLEINGTGCVTFSPASGSTRGNVISSQITFDSQSCLDSSLIKLIVRDSTGDCVAEQLLDYSGDCDNLAISGISSTAGFNFSVSVFGGTPGYTYQWVYDTNIFTPAGPTTNASIDLDLIAPAPSGSTTIIVIVTDSEGCQAISELTYNFCNPVAGNKTVNIACVEGAYRSGDVVLFAEPCPGCAIDWSTLNFYNASPGITVTVVNPNIPLIRINGVSGLTAGVYTVKYTVNDLCGQTSTEGTITIVLTEECSEADPFTLFPYVFTLECSAGYIVGDVVEIPIEQSIIPNTNIDWNSFDFVAPNCPPTCTTTLGAAVAWNAANRTIEYTIPALTGSDYLEWTICDNNGYCANNTAIFTIILDCLNPPLAVDDTACSTCSETIQIPILDNDDPQGGVIDTSSVIITQAPMYGSYVLLTGGIISYTPNAGFGGVDTMKYKVANTNGLYSNEATITITVVCAGESVNITVCD